MKLFFFGRLKDLAGQRAFSPPPELRTLAELRDWLARSDPALGEALLRPGVKIALNREIADLSRTFSTGDEVAFMSPLSGG